MISLVGAQRVGKTTLARQFAQDQHLQFLETNVSAIHKAVGIDPAQDLNMVERIALQNVILDGLTKQYELAASKAKVWITDRSPIDMAGYMLAAVTRTNCLEPGLSEEVEKYVQRCIDTANRFFGVLVLLQPGITPIDEPGKAPAIPAYQELMNSVMFGLLMDDRLLQRHYFIKRHVTDLEERKVSLFNAVSSAIDAQHKARELVSTLAH